MLSNNYIISGEEVLSITHHLGKKSRQHKDVLLWHIQKFEQVTLGPTLHNPNFVHIYGIHRTQH